MKKMFSAAAAFAAGVVVTAMVMSPAFVRADEIAADEQEQTKTVYILFDTGATFENTEELAEAAADVISGSSKEETAAVAEEEAATDVEVQSPQPAQEAAAPTPAPQQKPAAPAVTAAPAPAEKPAPVVSATPAAPIAIEPVEEEPVVTPEYIPDEYQSQKLSGIVVCGTNGQIAEALYAEALKRGAAAVSGTGELTPAQNFCVMQGFFQPGQSSWSREVCQEEANIIASLFEAIF